MGCDYKFCETSRSERYLVNTLFTHLLMVDNFSFLKKFFASMIFNDAEIAAVKSSADIEIVSELDPLRDGALVCPEVAELFVKHKRIAVPDLFLRWGDLCLVVEAKFFTNPSDECLHNQVVSQEKAIGLVREFTQYRSCTIHHATLTICKKTVSRAGVHSLLWGDVLRMADNIGGESADVVYARNELARAMKRAQEEFEKMAQQDLERYKFDVLFAKLPALMAEGRVYIGFDGGISKLATASKDYLVNRGAYKVSKYCEKYCNNGNWISLDVFIKTVMDVFKQDYSREVLPTLENILE